MIRLPRRLAAAGIVVALFGYVLVLSACGYHTAGHLSPKLAGVQTLAVPAFVNQTEQYKVNQVLTQAVVRELVTRTKFKVVSEVNSDTDATLRGYVTGVQIAPITFDSETGRASTVLVVISARVSLVDRHGNVLFENPNYVFRDQYQVSRELSSFFQEESPALSRLSASFAKTLVSNVLEAF